MQKTLGMENVQEAGHLF